MRSTIYELKLKKTYDAIGKEITFEYNLYVKMEKI